MTPTVKKQAISVELQKLQALNQVNLEIWQRIEEHVKEGWQRVASVNFDNSGNYSVADRLYVTLIRSPSISGKSTANVLTELGHEPFTLSNCWNCLKDSNIFRTPFPNDTYIDMNSEINNLGLLQMAVVLQLIEKWKEALEKVQVLLGKYEEAILADKKRLETIRFIFGYEFKGNVLLKPKHNPQRFSCQNLRLYVSLWTSTSEIEDMAHLIQQYYVTR